MEQFNVDFNRKRTVYSPTFYGEHKAVQIVSDLPSRLNDCDYYIVTFSMDGRLFDSEQITSESTGDITISGSKIYINLSQDYTNCNTLVFCVSGYKVDNNGDAEFIGKTGDSSTIVIKDTLHLGNEVLSDEPSLISRIREGLTKIRELARDRHTHRNKAVIDEITDQTLTNVAANTSARHTHSNKSVIDEVTAQTLTDVSANTENRHSHDNKAVIDDITAQTLADVSDNTAVRHSHANKKTLDSLRFQNAEYDYGTPISDFDNYLEVCVDPTSPKTWKHLRYSEDGAVIQNIEIITEQNGDKFLRLTINESPTTGRHMPRTVNIPIKSSSTGSGSNLYVDDGFDEIKQEMDSILPDWNENDSTDRAYIANRTHWVERNVAYEEYTVEYDSDAASVEGDLPDGQMQYWEAYNLGITLEEGETYYIQVGGETYESECQLLQQQGSGYLVEMLLIGNLHLYDQSALDTGCPILLAYVFNHPMGWIYNALFTDESLFGNDLTFRIGHGSTVYHKLSLNYLPDDVNDAVDKKHTHSNKSVLDSVTTQTLTNVAANTAAKHTHSNKSTLDKVTENDIGVRSDWNENDPTSKNYVANRTHWVEQDVTYEEYTVVYNQNETPSGQPDGTGQNWNAANLGIALDEDKTYYIRVGGETYECGSETFHIEDVGVVIDLVAIGNIHLYDQSSPDTGCPIMLCYAVMTGSYDWIYNILLTDESLFGSDLTFSIGEESVTYHPLSSNYMPDGVNDAVDKKHTHTNNTTIDALGDVYVVPNTAIHAVTYETRPINGVRQHEVPGDGYRGAVYAGAPLIFQTVQTQQIVITALTNNANYFYPEYVIEFTTGATVYDGEPGQTYTPPAPALILPEEIEWVDELTIEANKHYQISILNNIALWCAVDVEVEEEEE